MVAGGSIVIAGSASVVEGARIVGTTKGGRRQSVSIDLQTMPVLQARRARQAEESDLDFGRHSQIRRPGRARRTVRDDPFTARSRAPDLPTATEVRAALLSRLLSVEGVTYAVGGETRAWLERTADLDPTPSTPVGRALPAACRLFSTGTA